MNEAIFTTLGVTLTPWKTVGYAGTLLFSLRWLIQAHASRKAGSIRIPASFWWLSLGGSFLTLLYFVFGKNDSVGIISSIFPLISAAYSLQLHRRRPTEAIHASSSKQV
ncbi:lipid-A-disaccharide synthase N-terminal domain-containing protein [Xanthomonas sp. NCPPB 2632]|uniref:lipid-A-disaccharide synthase N-terminal domain-containing protein n=1 Tax=Xanthomonas sp. NCPPB 2632 TaxID=3240912 RepID=UPI0035137D45